uniref:Uncharacterized protein LOC100177472 n=1 Tax=Phallusia mammillata TaxID=59560 RepID=A0A6F9DFZ6_9ASCI|nr:uncharacterized protein LOC100177472 [Phallusia mammillata]
MESYSVKVLLLLIVVLLVGWSQSVSGCRSSVCRKRRSVTQEEVLLSGLTGCTGQTKPWLRQLAFCLGKSTAAIAVHIKDWYRNTYMDCSLSCAQVRMGTRDMLEISDCVDCFQRQLNSSNILRVQNVTASEVQHCIGQYVYAALSNELPTFDPISNARGRITLPRQRPANDWWSLTVRLPCKPPVFQFWNAYCINSFADDVRARDFVLSQNRLTVGNDITFLATFSDACRFDAKDIDIIWSESVPAFALPQLSSIGTSNPPRDGDQRGNIFFDTRAVGRLEVTDGGQIPAELRSETGPSPRRKRALSEKRLNEIARRFDQLGLMMPCTVKSFKVTDREGQEVNMQTHKKKHLIDTSEFWTLGNDGVYKLTQDISILNFTLNYGTNGCFFGASEVVVVVEPDSKWLTSNERVKCYTCNNVESEDKCSRLKDVKLCGYGEICQSEVRQIDHGKQAITKSCKQAEACENNFLNNNRLQCRPGQRNSVCRCCCSTDYCNSDAMHCT